MSKSLSWSLEAERHECWHARDVWQISSNHWWIQCILAGNNVASWHLSCSVSVNPFASTAAGGKILFGGNIGMWTIEVFLESVLPKLLSIEEDTHCPSSRMVINIMFFLPLKSVEYSCAHAWSPVSCFSFSSFSLHLFIFSLCFVWVAQSSAPRRYRATKTPEMTGMLVQRRPQIWTENK